MRVGQLSFPFEHKASTAADLNAYVSLVSFRLHELLPPAGCGDCTERHGTDSSCSQGGGSIPRGWNPVDAYVYATLGSAVPHIVYGTLMEPMCFGSIPRGSIKDSMTVAYLHVLKSTSAG